MRHLAPGFISLSASCQPGNHPVHGKGGRLAALVGAVELRAVEQRAAIVHGHRIAGLSDASPCPGFSTAYCRPLAVVTTPFFLPLRARKARAAAWFVVTDTRPRADDQRANALLVGGAELGLPGERIVQTLHHRCVEMEFGIDRHPTQALADGKAEAVAALGFELRRALGPSAAHGPRAAWYRLGQREAAEAEQGGGSDRPRRVGSCVRAATCFIRQLYIGRPRAAALSGTPLDRHPSTLPQLQRGDRRAPGARRGGRAASTRAR